MTYTPYSSDPSSSVEAAARQRKQWWLLRVSLFLLCVAPPALFYWWRFRPVTPKEPLARVQFVTGGELRLVGVGEGRRLEMPGNQDFSGRVVWDASDYRYSSHDWDFDTSVAWMFFSVFDPSRNAFTAPKFDSVEILDEDGMIIRGNTQKLGGNRSGLPPASGVIFDVMPRRSEQLKLRVQLGAKVQEITWANPFRKTEPPPFTAKPLPQSEEVDGAEIRLDAVTLVKKPAFPPPNVNYDVKLKLSAKLQGMENHPLETTFLLFDPTGNESPRPALPRGDRVWGVRVTATEPLSFPFPENQRLSVAKLALPGPGQAVKIPLHPKLISNGLVDMFVLGPGTFQWGNGRLMTTNANNLTTEIAKIAVQSSENWSSEALSILMVEGTNADPTDQRFVVRTNGEAIQHITSNSSRTSNGNITRVFSRYRTAKNRVPQPGEDLEIEMVFPKTRTATFYFTRPEIPAEPAPSTLSR